MNKKIKLLLSTLPLFIFLYFISTFFNRKPSPKLPLIQADNIQTLKVAFEGEPFLVSPHRLIQSTQPGQLIEWHREIRPEYHEIIAPFVHETESKSSIQDLTRLMLKAQLTEDHKCANLGILQFQLKNNTSLTFGLLPAHDDKFYEFRHKGGIWSIPRKRFLKIMKDFGATEAQYLGLPEEE